MEKLQRENENNKQLYKSLLKDYEDALYQLAEARLHIDRLRFGADVDINKHYIITHSKQEQGDPNAEELSFTRKEREMEACSGLINSIGDVQSRLNQLHEATARSEESPPLDAMNSELLDVLRLHERLSNELAPFLKEKESGNTDYVKNELSALGKQLEDFITLLQEREKRRAQDYRTSHESSYVPPITSIKNQFDELYLHSTSESAESEVDGNHGMSVVVKPLSSCPKYNAWLSNNNDDDESSSESDGIYGGNATEEVINGRQNTPSTACHKITSLSKGKASLIPRPVRVARSKKMDTNPEPLQHRQKSKPASRPSKIPTYKGKVFNKGNKEAQPSKIPKYKGNARQKENIGASKPEKHQAGPETVIKNARPPENEDKQDLIQLRNEISDLIKELAIGHLNPAGDSRCKVEKENEGKGNSKTSKLNRNEMERSNNRKGSKQSNGSRRAATSRLSPNPDLSMSDKSMMTIPPLIAEKCTQMPSSVLLPLKTKTRSKRRDRKRLYHKYYSSSSTSLSSLEDSEAVFERDKSSRKKVRNRLRDIKKPRKKKTCAKRKKTKAYLSKYVHSTSSSSSCTSIETTSGESMESAAYHIHTISPQRKKLNQTKLHHINSDFRPRKKTVPVYSCVHPQNLEPILACSHSCTQGPNLSCSVCSCVCHPKPPDLIPQKSVTSSHKSIDLSEAVELAQGIKNSSERMNKRLMKILIGGGECH
ncbi:PREDICTED: uncharacterized protein LOC100637037 [Amphimedon queenslandica]|nr:PREDICTED: uncharacterized protein LOC100637037 [Amphimedon queenslandica]|eukprot:XP_003385954.1 PREDICTED: uncharacterized protein LOC100637037 [Amphimedon queenslandica]